MKVWHTFTLDRYEATHASYADAAFYAQCNHDTNERPKRFSSGFYQLKRTFIATTEAAKENGFEFKELL